MPKSSWVSFAHAALVACALWLSAQLAASSAHAQDGESDTKSAAEDRATSFKAVEGAVKEDVPGGPLLIGAYGLILAVVVGYSVRLVRLQQRAQDDLARLERQLGVSRSDVSRSDV